MKKQLLISHNLFAENIPFVSELGGFSCPSLGISTNKHPLANFGDVTLLLDPKKFSPSKHPTYSSDVYSPRMPTRFFKVDHRGLSQWEDNAIKNLESLGDKGKALGRLFHLAHSDLFNKGIQSNILRFQESLPLLYLFAKEKGLSLNIPTEPISITGQGTEFLRNKKLLNKIYKEKLHLCITDTPEHDRLSIIALSAAKQYSEQQFASIEDPEDRKYFTESCFDNIKKRGFSNGKLSYSLMNSLSSYFQEAKRNTVKIDTIKANARFGKLVDGPRKKEAFQQWVSKTFTPFISKPYFNTYKRDGSYTKKEFSLKNVTQHMRGSIRGGEGSGMHGSGEIRAALIKQFKDKAQIIRYMDDLCSEKEMKVIGDSFNKALRDFPDKLKPYYKFQTDSMLYRDAVYNEIRDYAKRGKISSLNESFETDLIPDELITELDEFLDGLKHAKSHYFEAKVQGSLTLEDFSVAIVPKNTPRASVDILREKGLKIVTYQARNEPDRARAIQSCSDMMFGESGEFTPPKQTKKDELEELTP